ncbi:MAG: hypothetical protein P8X77_18615 [Maritimibacter sp.]
MGNIDDPHDAEGQGKAQPEQAVKPADHQAVQYRLYKAHQASSPK